MLSEVRLDLAQIGVDRLGLREVIDGLQPVLASDAGLLVAAERHLRRADIVVVDPDRSGL